MVKEETRLNLFLAFSAAVLTAFLFLFLFLSMGVKNRKYTYEDSKSLAKEISRKVASETQVYLSSALSTARSVTDRALIYRKLGGTRDDINELLLRTLMDNSNFMGVWTMWEPNAFDNRDRYFSHDTLYDSSGSMSVAFFREGDSVYMEKNDPADYLEDFYTLPLSARKELILDPFHYQYHGYDYIFYQTSAVVPVIVDSLFLGVFGIDINLDSLQSKLNRIRLYNTGFLSLISASGIIVSHYDSSMVDRNFFDVIHSSDRPQYSPLMEGRELTLETTSEFSGADVFRFFYPVAVGSGSKPWYIMVEIPIDQAIVRSKQLLYTACGTLLLGLLLLLYLIINIFDRRRYERYIMESIKNVQESNRIASENERKIRAIFDLSNQFLGLLTKDGKLMEVNRTALEFAGIKQEDVLGKYFWDTPWWSHSTQMQERLKAALEGAKEGRQEQFEATHMASDGSERQIIVCLSPVFDGQGNVAMIIPNGFDITPMKKAEEALKVSERSFRNVFDKTKHGILILGKDFRILASNRAVMDMTGYIMEDVKIQNVTDYISADQHQIMKDRLAIIAQGTMLSPVEYKVVFKNGETHFIEAESSVMDYYGQEAYLVMLRDVTHIKEAERKVLEAIIKTEENERSRISQDLHDGLGPVLSTIKIYFQVFQDTVEETKKEILTEKLKNTIEEAIRSVSEISHNISPHVLRNYGFFAALKQFIHRIELTNVVQFRIDCDREPELVENAGIILYRALTELINNSIRHSSCRNIAMDFSRNSGFTCVDYSDDGSGFDFTAITSGPFKGFGVQNIMNRVHALQGSVEITSQPGKGMTARIKIPE